MIKIEYTPDNIIIYTDIHLHTDIQAYIKERTALRIDSVYLITSFYEMLLNAS